MGMFEAEVLSKLLVDFSTGLRTIVQNHHFRDAMSGEHTLSVANDSCR